MIGVRLFFLSLQLHVFSERKKVLNTRTRVLNFCKSSVKSLISWKLGREIVKRYIKPAFIIYKGLIRDEKIICVDYKKTLFFFAAKSRGCLKIFQLEIEKSIYRARYAQV